MPDSHSLYLPCPRGLEQALAQEIGEIPGCTARLEATMTAGVALRGSLRDVMLLNLHSRIASRVLLRIAQGPAAHADDVYRLALRQSWERWFDASQTLRVHVTAERSPLTSLQFATLRAKDGVCDHFRLHHGERPNVARENPDVRVHVHLDATSATLYLDTSGEPLFKRGWRTEHGEAPLKENLAAGLLRLSGWTPQAVLYDPFCGAGTIAIEAAQMACAVPPGLQREFGFQRLQGFDAAQWRELREQASAARRDAPAPIVAADIDPRMVRVSGDNARRAGVEQALTLRQGDALEGAPPLVLAPGQVGWLLSNPPYAERIEAKGAQADNFLERLGTRLKHGFAGWNAGLLLADLRGERALGLKASRRHVLYNGPIECRLFTFTLVTGRPGRKPRP
ncbi:MAG: rRNA (guanine-N2)-methyltransferase [Betaproteobacteria bacterium]|nr:rRNA (guanine-N2)-methyltransferase [Betaproteobacteria bacterium]